MLIGEAQQRIQVGDQIEWVGWKVSYRVVLMGHVHGRQWRRLWRVCDRRTAERHPEYRNEDADEALKNSAVGPVRIRLEDEADRPWRWWVSDQTALLERGDSAALGIAEYGVGGVGKDS